MGRASRHDAGRDAIIGRSTRLRGRIAGDGDLLVEGTVDGDISVGGDFTLAEGGRATSNVDANSVVVRGDLEGDVRARGIVMITAGARVHGAIQGEGIAIEDGAEFVGQLDLEVDLPSELLAEGSSRR